MALQCAVQSASKKTSKYTTGKTATGQRPPPYLKKIPLFHFWGFLATLRALPHKHEEETGSSHQGSSARWWQHAQHGNDCNKKAELAEERSQLKQRGQRQQLIFFLKPLVISFHQPGNSLLFILINLEKIANEKWSRILCLQKDFCLHLPQGSDRQLCFNIRLNECKLFIFINRRVV